MEILKTYRLADFGGGLIDETAELKLVAKATPTPTLQEVTDAGNETTNGLILKGDAPNVIATGGIGIGTNDDGLLSLSNSNGAVFNLGLNITADLDFKIDDATGFGANTVDFTPNITDLDYTQKKYVDDKLANGYVNSNDTTLDINPTQENSYYTFTGTTSTWTLGTLADTANKFIALINMGSGDITLNSNTGGDDLWDGGDLESSKILLPGMTMRLFNNGTKFIINP